MKIKKCSLYCDAVHKQKWSDELVKETRANDLGKSVELHFDSVNTLQV